MNESVTAVPLLSRLRILFCAFFRISMVAVGGGLTMLPLIEAEFVEKRKWTPRKKSFLITLV